jgi:hypothetical protein
VEQLTTPCLQQSSGYPEHTEKGIVERKKSINAIKTYEEPKGGGIIDHQLPGGELSCTLGDREEA